MRCVCGDLRELDPAELERATVLVVYLLPEGQEPSPAVGDAFSPVVAPGKPMSGAYEDYAYAFLDFLYDACRAYWRRGRVADADALFEAARLKSDA